MAKRGRKLTIQRIAVAIGVSLNTATQYVARGCPRNSVAAVRKWRAANIKSTSSALDSSTNIGELNMEILRAKIAELLESARSRKLKNDRMEKRLIVRTELNHDLRTATAIVTTRIRTLQDSIPAVVNGELEAPIREAVAESIRVALKELDEAFH